MKPTRSQSNRYFTWYWMRVVSGGLTIVLNDAKSLTERKEVHNFISPSTDKAYQAEMRRGGSGASVGSSTKRNLDPPLSPLTNRDFCILLAVIRNSVKCQCDNNFSKALPDFTPNHRLLEWIAWPINLSYRVGTSLSTNLSPSSGSSTWLRNHTSFLLCQ